MIHFNERESILRGSNLSRDVQQHKNSPQFKHNVPTSQNVYRYGALRSQLPHRPREEVDSLGQLGKTGDGIIGRNALRRRISLVVSKQNSLHSDLLRAKEPA
jgi:hypothetical protein